MNIFKSCVRITTNKVAKTSWTLLRGSRHKQRKPAKSQEPSLTFVIPNTALQIMLYNTSVRSLDMTHLIPSPRTVDVPTVIT
jgi:hypothetical protein